MEFISTPVVARQLTIGRSAYRNEDLAIRFTDETCEKVRYGTLIFWSERVKEEAALAARLARGRAALLGC